ncbi:unnamed protein product, partial [Sphacelaria rigidula]
MSKEWLHFLPRSRDDSGVTLPVKGWRDFAEDSTAGILYLARVGKRRDWYVIARMIALRGGLQNLSSTTACKSFFAGTATMAFGQHMSSEASRDDDRAEIDEATPMRRRCARSIYELSIRPDKGPLLMSNGVLEALAALSAVVDPETIRYVGASYLNLAGLNPGYGRDMLKCQVVRCLHKLWMYAKNLAYARSGSSGISGSVDASESDEAWRQVEPDNAYPSIGLAACNLASVLDVGRFNVNLLRIRKCGLDVVHHVAIVICHLTMIMGSETIMVQDRGQECIMWYVTHNHGNERLRMLGLQCLVNFHLYTPTGTLHEAILPCLRELGRSDSVLIRSFMGKAISAIARYKQGSTQMLAAGVL